MTSTNAVTVAEGGTAEFQVKLNTEPLNPTTVTVSRASGDTDISVQSGASLVFDASNWNTNQTVTLAAASDADQVDGSAIIRCSAPETADQDVTATEAGQHTGAGDRDEHECGDGGGRRYGDFQVKLNTQPLESHDGDGQPGQRGYGHQRAVGRIAGVRRRPIGIRTRR